MKDELGTAGAVIGSVVIAGLLAGLALAIYPGWGPIGLFLRDNLRLSSDAPAWVQAVGSVLAIVASAYIASSQLRHTRQLETERYIKRLRSYEGLIVAASALVATAVNNSTNYGDADYYFSEEYDPRERDVLLAALSEIRFEWLESSEASMALLALRKALRDLDALVAHITSFSANGWSEVHSDPEFIDWILGMQNQAIRSEAVLRRVIEDAARQRS